jgi:two-component system osmolarity sensor histidine kinase EnvZ
MTLPNPFRRPPPTDDQDIETSARTGLSLFWRTFILLSLLLACSIWAWTGTLHELEAEPRAIQTGRQIGALVNLSRAAVKHADAIARVSLFKTMKDEEQVVIFPREPNDVVELPDHGQLDEHITSEIKRVLGPDTVVATRVNHVEGLWIGFTIDKDHFWLHTNPDRFDEPAGRIWLMWLTSAAAMSLAGAALIARLINRPLKDLSYAASRIHEGDFEASILNETVNTSEIRAVNVGFNRMTQRLAKIEEDRAVMLAGISHDLRTPLARLRLETELSVPNLEARAAMAIDIEQLDGIIDKFLDYARPGNNIKLVPVSLNDTVQACAEPLRKRGDVVFKIVLEAHLLVLADAVELQRIITNLLENALRYGKSVDSGLAEIDISARSQDKFVLLRLRDHGIGVGADQLKQLTTPFFRGEAARTEAKGTGLGLAIVDKTVSRMGGTFVLSNASSGGLCINIQLQRATGRLT